jgi:hypothetical protein
MMRAWRISQKSSIHSQCDKTPALAAGKAVFPDDIMLENMVRLPGQFPFTGCIICRNDYQAYYQQNRK